MTALHEKRAHEVEFNAAIQGPPKGHTLWTDEELHVLALEEIYLPTSTRHINLALVAAVHGKGLLLDRTYDSIKSQRKSSRYKIIFGEEKRMEVLDALSPLQQWWRRGATTIERRPASSRHMATASTSGVSKADRLLVLLEDLEEVQDESWRPDILEVTMRSLLDCGSPREGIDRWLRSTCKVKDEALPLRKLVRPYAASTKRAQRRHEYATVQNLWKRDRARVARCILKGEKLDGVVHLPPETAKARDLASLMFRKMMMSTPISSEEVEKSEISGQSAPGPDGIMVQHWRKIPTGLKVVLFNLFLLTDDFSDWLLQARTVLLPKIDKPSLPSDFQPISISSVIMRHYHKILAQRIQNCIKIAPQQRAFQSADGLAENLSLLSEVLHSATSQLRSTYMAVLNVKKAFDTVQHVPLLNILRSRGAPFFILRHIHKIYAQGTTSIQLPGQVLKGIPVHQGVR
ncbi:hypothetical protein PR048_010705 [Dryococelus australis]|uniref:Reverse transcriptase domain-containing protein n=1 Tax=Dryococelus australis TaxID=614101 RepID=A0ABQ9I4J1_9NEOP|nr:hypothetical protein PR048_010705 [Dryococelus australis]